MTCEQTAVKSGFVSLLGRPNVGKSTLLNSILGEKVAIVTSKPQTTRTLIRGIYTDEQGQIIFVDTPGIHDPQHRLGQHMVKKARQSMGDADLVLLIYDAAKGWGKLEEELHKELLRQNRRFFVVANKQDLVAPGQSQPPPEIDREDWFGISAQDGTGVAELVSAVLDEMPQGPLYYPSDTITDQPERVIAAELIREAIMELSHEEIPHSVAIEIQDFRYNPQKDITSLRAVIYVERLSQRKIIIGHQGSMIKKIGSKSREQIEKMVGTKVFLDLWVKVKERWRDKEGALREFGLGREE